MKTYLLAYGLLLITAFVNADEPVTGPSGTVCNSPGGSCKGLPDGVLIPYEGNCTRFLQCIGECSSEKKCSAGLHFNQKLQVCDWPAKAGCDQSYVEPVTGPSGIKCESSGGSCKNITDGTLIANSNSCTMYLECLMGCEINRNCPTGTHFSEQLKECTWPSEAGCDSSSNYQPIQTDKPTPAPEPTPCPCETSTTTTSSKPCVTPNLKPTPTSKPRPTGKPTANYKPTPTSQPGVSTSPTTAPCTSNCSTQNPSAPSRKPTGAPYKRTTPTSETSTTPEPTSTPKPSPSKPLSPSPKPTPQPGQSTCSGQESGTLLKFNGDCTKYIACGDGIAYIMDCGSGLHFNAADEICDWPEQAGCDPSYVRPENNPSCQSKGASCVGQDDGKLLPYAGKCDWFVACSNGCGYDMACGTGLHFNKYIEVCDWPEDAGCDLKKPNTTEKTPTTTGPTNSGTSSTDSSPITTRRPCQTCTTSSTTTPSCSCH